MRATVVHIPTTLGCTLCNWLGSQGGRRRTSALGGTWHDRAYEAGEAPQAPVLLPPSPSFDYSLASLTTLVR